MRNELATRIADRQSEHQRPRDALGSPRRRAASRAMRSRSSRSTRPPASPRSKRPSDLESAARAVVAEVAAARAPAARLSRRSAIPGSRRRARLAACPSWVSANPASGAAAQGGGAFRSLRSAPRCAERSSRRLRRWIWPANSTRFACCRSRFLSWSAIARAAAPRSSRPFAPVATASCCSAARRSPAWRREIAPETRKDRARRRRRLRRGARTRLSGESPALRCLLFEIIH